MSKSFRILISLILIQFFAGCGIIFEDDISEESIYMIIPFDGLESDSQDQIFWWEPVNGAIRYNMQMVTGSFSFPEVLVADTNIAGEKFEVQLSPGLYEWRIMAWNNYSETDYTYGTLTIRDTLQADEK